MNGAEVKRLSRLVFLGTGTSQGVPIIGCDCRVCTSSDPRDRRLRTSVLLESEESRVCIDTGPDFRTQMLREGIVSLDAVVYTHEHKDHLAGMDDIRPFNYLQKQTLTLHASEAVEGALRRDFHYAFDEHKHGGVPDVRVSRITDDDEFEAEEWVDPTSRRCMDPCRFMVFGWTMSRTSPTPTPSKRPPCPRWKGWRCWC